LTGVCCLGQLDVPESHRADDATVRRHFEIGFNDLKNAIAYTIGVSNNPGYYIAPLNNCISKIKEAACAAGGQVINQRCGLSFMVRLLKGCIRMRA
jgi:hypothetical protein